MSNLEQTLSIIKPDAVERNLEDKIKTMFKNAIQKNREAHLNPKALHKKVKRTAKWRAAFVS